MAVRTLDDLNVAGRRVLVRVDFNVPLIDGTVGDDTRIRAALPTIRELKQRNAAVILCSHLGRPKGERRDGLSLSPVAAYLAELLDEDVRFASDCVGEAARVAVSEMDSGEVVLLENLRFHATEERNDPDFARQLAELADCYVNDAFGAAHRAHASTEGVANLLPSAAGLLMAREVKALSSVLEHPEPPLVLIIGGAKVSDKFDVIETFIGIAQQILIGGGMANTFLEAKGNEVGASLSESELADEVLATLERAASEGTEVILPLDVMIAKSLDSIESAACVDADRVPPDQAIFDIGPKSVSRFESVIGQAGTVVWNGPMGVFERPPFDQGTLGVATAVARSESYSLVGGGDSVAALNAVGMARDIDHVSTGGGASLEFLGGKKLPGIVALEGTD